MPVGDESLLLGGIFRVCPKDWRLSQKYRQRWPKFHTRASIVMIASVPLTELNQRLQRFRARMEAAQPEWELAVFLGKINQYYFTGTMQDGMLLIPSDSDAVFWVRRSFDRAREESKFPDIRPMTGFREAAQTMPAQAAAQRVHLETESVPFALVQRFRKHFPASEIASVDPHVGWTRSVKSPYELAIMERAGAIHQRVLEVVAPALLREGMSEAAFACDLFTAMVREGHQGTVRCSRFNADLAVGQFGFGENSLYPTSFDGPAGCRGISPAAPVLGSRERLLRRGDLVFADVGCYVDGYSTDKTMTYVFDGTLPESAWTAHEQCMALERQLAEQLKPGAIPSKIYANTITALDPQFLEHFMGFGNRRVQFLGHGVGLHIDETPVIAEGFDEPLMEGMVLALEPKRGVPGVGMVGVENTYVVTPEGGRSITGTQPGPILVS